MKVIITADWHFGYPSRLNDLKWAFISLIDYCVDKEINLILMLGDLTHDREHMTHDVSNVLSECLDYMNNNGVTMITLIGNHDMFMRHKWSINAIKPFSKQLICVDDVSYFELCGRKFWIIPFIEHERSYMKVVETINKNFASENDVLLTHIGVNAATLNVCFLVQNWNIVNFEDTIFSRIYTGHFHCTQQIGKTWYPGSPIPFKFDEGQVEHGFFVYDVIKNEHEFVDIYNIGKETDIKPADYITLDSESISDLINVKGAFDNNNIKVILKSSDDRDVIQKRLKDAGAARVIFVAPKEEKIDFSKKDDNFSRSNTVFLSWLKYDNPQHLNHDLLIRLESEIRSETQVTEDD